MIDKKGGLFSDPTEEFKVTEDIENDKKPDDRDYFKKTLEERMGEYTNIDDFETYY